MTTPQQPHGPLRSFGRLKSRPVKPRQQALLDRHGGREAAIARGDLGFTPAPGTEAAFN